MLRIVRLVRIAPKANAPFSIFSKGFKTSYFFFNVIYIKIENDVMI